MTAALATRFATLGVVVALVVAACGGSSSEESSRQNPAGIGEADWTPQYIYWQRPEKMDDGGANLPD